MAASNLSGITVMPHFEGGQVSLQWALGNRLCPSPPLPFPCSPLSAALLLSAEECISFGAEGKGRVLRGHFCPGPTLRLNCGIWTSFQGWRYLTFPL